MKDSQFDNYLRDHLHSHASPVDSPKIWTGVEAGLQGRRKIGNWVFWLGAFLLVFFLAGLAYITLPGKNAETGKDSSFVSETSAHQSVQEIEPSNQAEQSSFVSGDVRGQINESGNNPDQMRETSTPSDKTSNTRSAVNNAVETGSAEDAAEEPTLSEVSANPIFQGASGQMAGNNPSGFIQKTPSFAKTGSDTGKSSKEIVAVHDDHDAGKSQSKNTITDQIPADAQVYPVETSFNPSSMVALSPMLPSVSGNLMLPETSGGNDRNFLLAEKRQRFFLQLSAGGGFVQRDISSLHSAFDAYALQRSLTESPLEYLSVQGNLGYYVLEGLYVSGGINITTINEHFHLNREVVTHHEETVITHIHVDADGDSNFHTGTAITTIHHTTHFSHYNKLTLIDIPVFLGYEWNFNRWTAGIEGGVLWNLSLRTQGTMLGTSDEIVRMEDSNAFQKRLNQNYAVNLRFGYQLGDRLSINLSPGVRFINKSVLTAGQIDQHYRLMGVQGGLVYRFP